MRKVIVGVLLTALTCLTGGSVLAEGGEMQVFYVNYVHERIARCEQATTMANSELQAIADSRKTESTALPYPTGADTFLTNLRRYAKIKKLQADYYREHLDDLVNEMMARKLGANAPELDHFVTISFYDALNATSPVVQSAAP